MDQQEFERRKRRLTELLDEEMRKRRSGYTRYVDIQDDIIDAEIIDAEFYEVQPEPIEPEITIRTVPLEAAIRATLISALGFLFLGTLIGWVF